MVALLLRAAQWVRAVPYLRVELSREQDPLLLVALSLRVVVMPVRAAVPSVV
jgi:hypothetical protein